ncbi:hypothetical protein CF137_01655, partial [Aeromonas sobria]
ARNCDKIRQKHWLVCGSGADPLHILVGLDLMTTVPNPKALMFVVALLPQFVDPDHAVLPQWGLMAMTTVIVHFCVYWGYAVAGHKASRYLLDTRIRRFYNGASGVLFLGFAVGWMFGSW